MTPTVTNTGELFMKKKVHATNVFIKKCIAQALMKLLKEKELSAISITELTKVAGVSRMAYYRNYTSKEEVISSYCDIILQQYDEEEIETTTKGSYSDMNHMLHYFTFLIEHQDFLDIITTHACGHLFSDAITDYIVNKWQTDKNDRREYYHLIAFSGSLYRLYLGWAENHFQESPEEMAQIFSSLQPKM